MAAPQDSDAHEVQTQGRKWSVSDITVTPPGVIKRAVAAAAIGNVTEWFDFGVYSYLETPLQKVFFSGLDQTTGMIATLGLFAAAFLVRPFGGLFFGPLGDRIGRTKVLSLTVILMAIGTLSIGLLPGSTTIGVAAPMLMLLARLVQGFSTGGEYGGAMTFIAEYAPDRRRGFLGSFLEFGTLTGYLMGATFGLLLTTFLPDPELLSWGWRIPFLIAGPLGVIGLYLRTKLEETPAFAKIAEESQGREGNQTLAEFRSIFVKHWRTMVVCIGLVLVFNVTNYMLTVYIPTYLTKTLPASGNHGVGDTLSQVLQVLVLVVLMIVITFIGRLSDRFGRRAVIMTGSVALIVLSIPSVLLIRSGSPITVFGGLLVMGLMLVCFSATMPSTLPALFPTDIRYGGLSIAFNISVSLFGGTTATVVGILVAWTNNLNMPAYYLMAAGVIGAISIYFTRESARRPLPGSAPSVATDQEAKDLVASQR